MRTFRFATAGDDVRIWNASTLELLHHFYVPGSSKTQCIGWSDDGQHLLAVPKSGEFVFLTQLAGTKLEHTTVKLAQSCTCATFKHTTSRFLGIGCSNGEVLVWDTNSRKPRGTFQPHKAAVTSVCFNVADSVLASSGVDGEIVLNNTVVMTSSTSIASLKGQVVRRLAFAPYRKYLLVSASNGGRIDLWDTSSYKQSHTFTGLHEDGTGVAFSPVNDSFLLSVGMEGNVGMYDVGNKKLYTSVKAPEGLHSVCFLHNGAYFVVGGASGNVYVYDVRQPWEPIVKTLLAHVGPVTSACMQPLATSEDGVRGPLDAVSSFALKPVETRVPMTLTAVIPDERGSAFSPLTAPNEEGCSLGKRRTLPTEYENGLCTVSPLTVTRSSAVDTSGSSRPSIPGPLERTSNPGRSLRTLRRETKSSETSSILSVDYAEGYGIFSPLNATHSVRSSSADRSCFGQEPSSPCRLESSPAVPVPIPGCIFENHEETGQSAVTCDSSGDVENNTENGKPPVAGRLHDRVVNAATFDSNGGSGELELMAGSDPFSNEGSSTERAASPSNLREFETSTAGDEDARVKRAIHRLRLLYDVADDGTMLDMASTVQVVRRVVRQEVSDVVETLRAELNSCFNGLLVDLRNLSAEVRALKEF